MGERRHGLAERKVAVSEYQRAPTAGSMLRSGSVVITSSLLISAGPFFNSQRHRLVVLAARYTVATWRESVAAGGLISYGPSLTGMYRLLGTYAGKTLNGAKPADLPVQQPTKFELVVNFNTAKELGLTVPPSILARADEVIE